MGDPASARCHSLRRGVSWVQSATLPTDGREAARFFRKREQRLIDHFKCSPSVLRLRSGHTQRVCVLSQTMTAPLLSSRVLAIGSLGCRAERFAPPEYENSHLHQFCNHDAYLTGRVQRVHTSRFSFLMISSIITIAGPKTGTTKGVDNVRQSISSSCR
jgi:hypothetical protein